MCASVFGVYVFDVTEGRLAVLAYIIVEAVFGIIGVVQAVAFNLKVCACVDCVVVYRCAVLSENYLATVVGLVEISVEGSGTGNGLAALTVKVLEFDRERCVAGFAFGKLVFSDIALGLAVRKIGKLCGACTVNCYLYISVGKEGQRRACLLTACGDKVLSEREEISVFNGFAVLVLIYDCKILLVVNE